MLPKKMKEEAALGVDGGVVEDVEGHRSVGFAIDAGGEELDDPFVSEVLK